MENVTLCYFFTENEQKNKKKKQLALYLQMSKFSMLKFKVIIRLMGHCFCRYHVWAKGHAATDYEKWRTASVPYTVSFDVYFL